MTSAESLEEIKKLLLTFPGITSAIIYRNNDERKIRIRFRCNSIEDLKTLADLATSCNVRIHLDSPDSAFCGEGADANPDHLPCDLEFRDNEDFSPTQTEVFGVFMTEALEDCGLISAEERRRLQVNWQANRRH